MDHLNSVPLSYVMPTAIRTILHGVTLNDRFYSEKHGNKPVFCNRNNICM
jgi:hypothetical protein